LCCTAAPLRLAGESAWDAWARVKGTVLSRSAPSALYGLPLRCKRAVVFWIQVRTAINISGLLMHLSVLALMTIRSQESHNISVSNHRMHYQIHPAPV
jgi:hypothetical protein